MQFNRRTVLGLAVATWSTPVPWVLAHDETRRVQREIDEATARGRPWLVPAGITRVNGLRLPEGAHLVGQADRSRLQLVGTGPLLMASGARRITLESVVLDGAGERASRDLGLVQVRDVVELRLRDCIVERFGGNGVLMERSGGRVTGSIFRDHGRAAVFALDSRNLSIDGNTVQRCGENGFCVWQSVKREDGSIIRGNRISDIRADAGGSGQYGNAVALFRAGGVIVEGNQVRRVAYTGVRTNSVSNVVINANTIQGAGECAIFTEFAFDGASIVGNVIQDAYEGIHVANFADHGGRLSTISANVIRGTRAGPHPADQSAGGGFGIHVEGDSAITGNMIEGAPNAGMRLGWGPSLRDVTAQGNTIRECGDGVQISVAPGAGAATVIGNTFSAVRRSAIIGMRWHIRATGDLAKTGARDFPMLRLAENAVR